MKRTTLALGIALVVILAAGILLADALPMDWFRKRNGLTDAQVDDIFERNPNAVLRLSRGKWMELKYRLHRFDNMKDWLNMQIQGKLGDKILEVTDANQVLNTSNSVLRVEIAQFEPDAKELRKAVKAAEKAAKKDSKNFEKWVKDTKKARDKSSEDMAEFYDAILEIATGSVPN